MPPGETRDCAVCGLRFRLVLQLLSRHRAEAEVVDKMASARGFMFVAVLFLMSLLYSVTLLAPACLLLIPLSPPGLYLWARRAYRRWTGFVGYLFFGAAAYLLENFCGIKVG